MIELMPCPKVGDYISSVRWDETSGFRVISAKVTSITITARGKKVRAPKAFHPAEYIEREALIAEFKRLTLGENSLIERLFADGVYAVIESFPAADVAPVVHGEWIEKPTGRYGQWQSWCSACGKHSGIGGIESNRHKPYCPNCGAKMDGERKESNAELD